MLEKSQGRVSPHEYEIFIKSPEEAAIKTKELIEKGADVIKVWAGLSEDDYRAVVDVAHQHGIKVHAHLYHPTAIRAAIAADVDVFQHVGSARNPPYDDDLLAQIAHNSIPVVQTIPTVSGYILQLSRFLKDFTTRFIKKTCQPIFILKSSILSTIFIDSPIFMKLGLRREILKWQPDSS